MIELRRNPLLSEWVIINDNRDVVHKTNNSKSIQTDSEQCVCPFCR